MLGLCTVDCWSVGYLEPGCSGSAAASVAAGQQQGNHLPWRTAKQQQQQQQHALPCPADQSGGCYKQPVWEAIACSTR